MSPFNAVRSCIAVFALTLLVATGGLAADQDADGIQSNIDLDDDNDGILDQDELYCDASGQVAWVHELIGGVLGAVSIDAEVSSFLSGSANLSVGPGLTELLNVSEYLLSGASELTFSAAKSSDDYLEVGFTFTQDTYLYGSTVDIISALLGGAVAADYEFAAEISDDSFVTASVLFDDGFLSAPLLNLGSSVSQVFSPYLMEANIAYSLRIYLFDAQNGSILPRIVSFGNLQLLIGASCNADFDADLVPNSLDIDSDNDGILDNIEAQLSDSYIAPTGVDTDQDGIDDSYDVDAGGVAIIAVNTDLIDTPDYLDTDSDNDGVTDAVEAHDLDADGVADTFVVSLNDDADADGLNDNFDTVFGPAIANVTGASTTFANSDGLDLPDWRDTDDDNDSILTAVEDANANGDWLDDDVDADGSPDYLESGIVDTDNDGVVDQSDAENLNPCIPSVFGNGCTVDTDQDGVSDSIERAVTDTDSDGILDYLESSLLDADVDGVNDQSDSANLDACVPSVFNNSCLIDSDSDGVPDNIEGELIDTDTDGTPDYLESSITDADGDGVFDQLDIADSNACLPILSTNCPTDTDADGIPDSAETLTADTDGDGLLDYLESSITDGDDDGVVDQDDIDNLDACIPSELAQNCLNDSDADGIPDNVEGQFADIDNDGRPNSMDIDSDGDGIPDVVESASTAGLLDTDSDGQPDYLDIDSDNDGIVDMIESQSLTEYRVPLQIDTDEDGLDDTFDEDNNGVASDLVNTDLIDAPDYLDTDSDNDGVLDAIEAFDANGDGIADVLALANNADVDQDGLNDAYDIVLAPSIFNALGANASLDNTDVQDQPNWRDTDDDNDGVLTLAEDANANGRVIDDDADGDGILDFVESSLHDTDGDGTVDQLDIANMNACVPSGFSPTCLADSDADGILDSVESETADTDADGIADYLESNIDDADSDGFTDQQDSANNNACLPSEFSTNCSADSDGDGVPDNLEGINADTDGDGIFDFNESLTIDSDNDGLTDQLDNTNDDACQPSVFNSSCLSDTDADGATDNEEGELVDSDADGTPDYLESSIADADGDGVSDELDIANSNACVPLASHINCPTDTDADGIPDTIETVIADTDGDGILDYQESVIIDSDGDGVVDQDDIDNTNICLPTQFVLGCLQDSDDDGIIDFVEGEFPDLDNDGKADFLDADSDGDGIADAVETADSAGLRDTDADGIPDHQDIDSDNDGVVDLIEAQSMANYRAPMQKDLDFDGIDDSYDEDNGGIAPELVNSDSQDLPDYLDEDSDNDGIPDSVEAFDGNGDGLADILLLANNADADKDGLNDAYDTISAPNVNNALGSNALSVNTDGDGAPDWRDEDDDGDGVLTSIEDANGNGTVSDDDADTDGILDYAESFLEDADGDGINDQSDISNFDACVPNVFGSNCTSDTDQDGAPDSEEGEFTDTDTDGIRDYLESSITDADGDGIANQFDIADSNSCVPSAFGTGCGIDTDADTMPDSVEGEFTDTDQDGTVDYLESSSADADGDGVANQLDSANNNACIPSSFGNNCTIDSDSDGIPDSIESASADGDGDGVVDYLESIGADADGDGVTDQFDIDNNDACSPSQFGNNCAVDTDADGRPDSVEGQLADTDADGVADYLESSSADADGDGVTDQLDTGNDDACDPSQFGNNCSVDTDSDGTPDSLEGEFTDEDGDGVFDYAESATSDLDADGISDQSDINNVDACLPSSFASNCSADTDGDGVADNLEGEELDEDGDGLANFLESSSIDTDGDGVSDQEDPANTNACAPSAFGTNCDLDTDGDGVPDSVEGATADSDNDGANNFEESSLADADLDGTPDQVDPDDQNVCVPTTFGIGCAADSDGDGMSDFMETEAGDVDNDGLPNYIDLDSDSDLVPDSVESAIDTDSDGILNPYDTDSDNDGISDNVEAGRLPVSPIDTDGDGIIDMHDLDSDNDGLLDELEALVSVLNDEVIIGLFSDSANDPQDFDGDRIPDYRDRDSDNDSISDLIESEGMAFDSNADGVLDAFLDANGNGLHDALEEAPVQPTDIDADGVPDFLDADSDGDGVLDSVEVGGVDLDADGVIDSMSDTDSDGIPDSVDADFTGGPDQDADGIEDSADADFNGSVGGRNPQSDGDSGGATTDTDGDNIIDSRDADADGDGFADEIRDAGERWSPSDINSNGVPDFQETGQFGAAKVGLSGSGCSIEGGSKPKDPLFPLLLVVAFFVIFRKLQWSRLISIPAMLALLTSLLVALPARADSDSKNAATPVATQYKAGNFYVGAGLGFTKLEPDTRELFNTEANDTSSVGFQFLAGINVNQWLSLEFNLTDLGAAGFDNGAEIEYQQYGASALFYAPRRAVLFGKRSIVAFGRIGYGVLENTSSGDIEFEQVNSNHLLFGLGAEYLTRGNWGARLEGYQFDEDILYVQLALIYRFRRKLIPYVPSVETSRDPVRVPSARIVEPVIPEKNPVTTQRRQQTVTAVPQARLPLSIDADQDGVVNDLDKCKFTLSTAQVNSKGCHFFKEKLRGVTFLSGSGELTGLSKRILDDVASELVDYPKFRFIISSHTDNVEIRNVKSDLSQQRADVVVDYLVSRGVNKSNLTVVVQGDAAPIASNETRRGRAKNRRVDVELIDVKR